MAGGGNTAQQLLRSLEERAKELEILKKEFQKCEKERNLLQSQKHTFDSKQPTDVKSLIAQRRELHAQLQREESEKHELLTQINELIGEVAGRRADDDGEIVQLKAQLEELIKENEILKKDFGRKEAAFQNVSDQLRQLSEEMERRERTHQRECAKLTEEVQDCQREIEHKAAALQSLTLAKQGFRNAQDDKDELSSELNSLRHELQEKEDLIRELTESNDELGKSLSETGSELDASQNSIQNLKNVENELRRELDELRERLQKVTHEKSTIELDAETFRVSLKESDEALKDFRKKLRDSEMESTKLQNQLEHSNLQLNKKIKEIEDLHSKLKSEKVDEVVKISSNQQEKSCPKCEELLTAQHEIEKNSRNCEEELREKLFAIEKDLNEKRRQFTKLNNELKMENENLREKIQTKTERLAKVESFVESLEQSVQLIENQNQESGDLLNEKYDQITQLENEIENLKQKLEESQKNFEKYEENLIQKIATKQETDQNRDEEMAKKIRNLEYSLLQSQNSQDRFTQKLSGILELDEEKISSEELWKILDIKIEKFKQQTQIIDNLQCELSACKANEQLANETVESLQKTLNTFASNAQRSDILIQKLEEKHEHEKKSLRDEMIENVSRVSVLLDKQTEKYNNLHKNYEFVQNEVAELKSEVAQLHNSNAKLVADKTRLADENSQILSKTTELEVQLMDAKKSAEHFAELKLTRQDSCSSHSSSSESDENPNSMSGTLKRRVSELTNENARLAGDLLKQQTAVENEFRRQMQIERQKWVAEKAELEAQIVRIQNQMEELSASQQEQENRKNSAEPIPKPRKSSSTNLMNENKLNNSSLTHHEIEQTAEIAKLQADLEKQKRLVTVLRKKLQQDAIASALLNRNNNNNNNSGANSQNLATMPRHQ